MNSQNIWLVIEHSVDINTNLEFDTPYKGFASKDKALDFACKCNKENQFQYEVVPLSVDTSTD